MDRWFLHRIPAFSLAIPLAGCGEAEAPPPPVVRPVKILESGGLMIATVLTMVFVPVLYAIIFRVES